MNIGQRILWCNSCHFDISMLAQLNDCIGGLLHLGPNVITCRTLLHLGQLLHLGLQHTVNFLDQNMKKTFTMIFFSSKCASVSLVIQNIASAENIRLPLRIFEFRSLLKTVFPLPPSSSCPSPLVASARSPKDIPCHSAGYNWVENVN